MNATIVFGYIIGAAIDPLLWVGPIVGAIAFKKWWQVLAASLGWEVAVVVLFMEVLVPPSYENPPFLVPARLIAAGLVGSLAFLIAYAIRKKPAQRIVQPPSQGEN